ncbi:myb-related transcription factor, partner of profilin-like [Tympanuchus pallidicinctus]|uniref:myb-related transcription factor, partner of profilin-like n=1 Tax=Tympanuchus pallidicinctus TaxID=109042 RepID=UPI002286F2D7|nr:myb-related transcription factor, partner of profilin-like [Tympanuchus pallidicinctus]
MAAAGGAARRGLLKRKPNFTLQEIEILMSEVLRYEPLLFGAAASTVNAYEKQKIWWRITNKINAAGRNQRDIGEVKNRWRGLRRRANDKITRHRQERQGPAPRTNAARHHGAAGTGTASAELGPGPAPLWGPRGGEAAPLLGGERAAPCGVKEEAVKEEPMEVKTEPFHDPTDGGTVPARRQLRSSTQTPGEGWSPPQPPHPDLGIQPEPPGCDFPSSVIFEPDTEQLSDCSETGGGTPGGTDGTPESSARLSPAELRLIRCNERLVQEMRAFRRECAESRREMAAVLRSIAQALGGLSASLAQIRERYLGGHAAPQP